MKVRIAEITESPLDVAAHSAATRDAAAGADVSFCGVVRDHDDGRTVLELEYTSHPSAAGSPAPGRGGDRRRPGGARGGGQPPDRAC